MFQQLRRIWEKMAGPQRTLVVGVAFLAVTGAIGAAFWGAQPAFRLLQGGLDRETASKALARLDEAGVHYRLENDGRDVLVDANDFARAQATLVQGGIAGPDEGSGYKGLDGVSFGLTEEQQKLRMRIALEEEIARSLRQFDGVESAKVHLAPAERSYARKDSMPAKASAVLRLRAGKVIDDAQAEAMVRMIANASPGLAPENVILTDTRGSLLARAGGGGDAASTLNRTRVREHYLADKAQSALDRAFGADKAIVRVDVVLDTERVDSTRTLIKPETKVVVQEKISSTENAARTVGGPVSTDSSVKPGERPAKAGGSTTEDVTASYDYDRETIRKTEEKSGTIRRLTVGVLADQGLEAHKKQVEDIVKGAVGWDSSRGDPAIEVAFVPFAERPALEEGAPATTPVAGFAVPPVIELVKWGVTGLVALALAFLVLRSIKSARTSVRVALAEAAREQKIERRVDPSEQIAHEIERDAQAVGRLLRNWLYETSSRN